MQVVDDFLVDRFQQYCIMMHLLKVFGKKNRYVIGPLPIMEMLKGITEARDEIATVPFEESKKLIEQILLLLS